jgi:molybdate transport repressor ModE-like protein
MHRLALHYSLRQDPPPALVQNPLIDLLRAVDSQGSISGAAKVLGLSYRHVWGELKRWEQELGQALLVWEKGQAARLTEFGAKLMWAERQAQARLAPQIEALRSELERSFALAFDPQQHVLTLFASHDEALSALRAYASAAPVEPVHLDVRFMGSLDAMRALNEGRCSLASFHTLAPATRGGASQRAYKRLLQPGLHKIIGFALRWQGLLVAPGNPLGLHNLGDAARSQARFALRSVGSGTRVVLHELLDATGLKLEQLNCPCPGEPSHAAVAQAVASGACDVGLGMASTAAQARLDFVPLAQEQMHLVCLKSELEAPGVRALRALLQQPGWAAQLGQVAGHQPHHSGQVLSLQRMLPWWALAPKATPAAPFPT